MSNLQEKKPKNAERTAKKQQKRVIGRPFKKGQSGNPKGRPKGTVSITTEIKKKLDEVAPGQKRTYLELLIMKVLKRAMADESDAMMRLIWNYVDGLPRQRMEMEGDLKIKEKVELDDEQFEKLIQRARKRIDNKKDDEGGID